MKNLLTLATLVIATATLTAHAETSVKLTGVHLCCGNCVKGADKAVTSVTGATSDTDKDARTITIKAADTATAQKAVDALVAAGYFGVASDSQIKVKAHAGAKKANVQSLKLNGVHLCCAKCVTAVNDAISKVDGVKANTAAKGAESFEVTGDFSPKDVIGALNKAGLTGKVGK
ncbi:MAG: cation transporter [Verrucomicrobia bacterium]|nr:cation transporter [Verrucomicrobiota bacterium]MBI3870392.1 cation transporter [Verrucomicrobiota bacterium]